MKKLILAIALLVSWTGGALAAISDEQYIQYQVEVQTLLYKDAQDPAKMMAEMKPIQEKYKPDSEEWSQYYEALQKDPTRFLKLHGQIEEQLKKNGIQWEKQN